jgi:aminomethyltransferase
MKQTTLHAEHEALGARLVPFAGWSMPLQYRPILEEVRCVRERVGLFDLGHMGRLELRGAGAVAALDRVVTNHVAKIPVGAIRYGLVCREDGDPIDDVLVYRGEDHVLVVVNASNNAAVQAWWAERLADELARGDVQVVDRTDELGMIALQGPGSQAALAPLVEGYDLAALRYYRFAFARVAGIDGVRISRTGYTGEDGFELYLPAERSAEVWRALLAGEPSLGLWPIGLGARDTLRLEAGMPLYGHEIGPGRNPIEAGLAFGVSFAPEKADTIGRAALERISKAPRRRLVGLTTDGPRVPRQGHALLHGDEVVGEVCSGTVSPTVGKNIASAYLRLGLDVPGTEVELDLRGKRQTCRVQELPFYSRTRR